MTDILTIERARFQENLARFAVFTVFKARDHHKPLWVESTETGQSVLSRKNIYQK